MKAKLTKLAVLFLLFLLCFNIYSLSSLILNSKKFFIITYQEESFLNSSDESGSLILRVGKSSGPYTLEPVDCWDSSSNNVIEQVVENLFTYDFADPELPRINELAESYWWEDLTTLKIKLKQNIFFHDGTLFNAEVAKWNLDRLLYLTNCTGTNAGEVAHTRILWLFSDEVTPIIASVSTVGTWNITIHLNAPFAPLLDLLCFVNAAMLSPVNTPTNEFLDLSTDLLIGTGPFKFDYYIYDTEVKFTRWDNYWRKLAFFEKMSFIIFDDYINAHYAMMVQDIDINMLAAPIDLPIYDADPKITLKRFTDDSGIPSLVYQYIGINNQKHNQTWRKAMSYAINYTYIIEKLRSGNGLRANSLISPAFGAAYNSSATAANYNLTIARNIMQSMGYGIGLTSDQDWIDQANNTPFLTVRYTYNAGSSFRESLENIVENSLRLIGIALEYNGVSWSDFLNYLFADQDHLGLFGIGWSPDYLEPYNMLDPLVNPISETNSALINDTYINSQIALALNTTNDAARNNIYKNIQWYMAEVGYNHIYLYHSKVLYVHSAELKGVPYNAMGAFYAYPIYSIAPGKFALSSNAGSPDLDGYFTLNWSESSGADNYSVYRDTSNINSLSGSPTVLAREITENTLTVNELFFGEKYYIVEAINASGNTLSNCLKITVVGVFTIPGYAPLYFYGVIVVSSYLLIRKRKQAH
ncbi:MAG: ABC transporter substrate-binding protein [Promethearchaeota archaeon]